jgi:hypothetical protein
VGIPSFRISFKMLSNLTQMLTSPKCSVKLERIGMSDHCHLSDVLGNSGNDSHRRKSLRYCLLVQVVGVAAIGFTLN